MNIDDNNQIKSTKPRGVSMELYLETKTRSITNQKEQEVSLGDARVFWEQGEVTDCSLSFQRLASFDFDFDQLDKFYEECQ